MRKYLYIFWQRLFMNETVRVVEINKDKLQESGGNKSEAKRIMNTYKDRGGDRVGQMFNINGCELKLRVISWVKVDKWGRKIFKTLQEFYSYEPLDYPATYSYRFN